MPFIEESKDLRIPFNDIREATENFTNRIGRGGFGFVYRGKLLLSGQLTTVAVKQLQTNISGQGVKEYLTEIQLLSRYKHPNIVSLVGFCEEGNEKFLVYEYAEHGSLDNYLIPTKTRGSLTWEQRISICVDAARGLDHLHNHVAKNQRVIHRDIKSANILLDHNWKAMIADFGLSKIGRANENDTYVITCASGTRGYCDPAYMETGILTKESDIYSFGVVLLEVLCGRLCVINVNSKERFLVQLARGYFQDDKLDLIIDCELKNHVNSNSMVVFLETAFKCLQDDRERRPSMGLVLQSLEKALELLKMEENFWEHDNLDLVLPKCIEAHNFALESSIHEEELCVLPQALKIAPIIKAEKMNNAGVGSSSAIPLVPENQNHHNHQQQQNHLVVPIVSHPVPPLAPAQAAINLPCLDLLEGSRADYVKIAVPLYKAAIRGDWKAAKPIIDKHPEVVRFAITENYDTLLHVAASAESTKAVEEFVRNLVCLMEGKDLELQNKNYDTALALAAAAGNVKTARIMVNRAPVLTEIPGKMRTMPLYMAALFEKYDMVRYLYSISKKMEGDFWTNENRSWVLQRCVEADIFDVALQIVNDHPELLFNKGLIKVVLLPLAHKTSASIGIKPHIIFRIIKSLYHLTLGPGEKESEAFQLLRIIWKNIATLPKNQIDDIIQGPCVKQTVKVGHAIEAYPSHVLFLAAKMGNTRFIVELIRLYPDLIWKQDVKGRTIFHIAIKHRQAKIYNLLYEIGAVKGIVTVIKDIKGNNMLHMVAKSPKQKLFQNGSAVALLMQQELLWFKEVEQVIPPRYRQMKNEASETPQDLFTKTHADLLTKSEKWMKNIAFQSMVVAALILTIIFSTVFLLPNGFNQGTSVLFFRKEPSLLIFAISNTVSLIFATTSLIMSLAIQTSQYAEHDFLESLPKKLMFGFATLMLSMVTLMFAYGASLCNKNLGLAVVIIPSLAGMLVILLTKLQFRLLVETLFLIYGSRYLFKPKQRILYF